MESNGIHKVYKHSSVPTLYLGSSLISCFLEGNATSTIPHQYSSRQKVAFECSCANSAGPTLRRGSHVYEINTWLWNFGSPQRKRGLALKLRWLASDLCLVYTGIYQVPCISCLTVKHAFWKQLSCCHVITRCEHAFPVLQTSIDSLKA